MRISRTRLLSMGITSLWLWHLGTDMTAPGAEWPSADVVMFHCFSKPSERISHCSFIISRHDMPELSTMNNISQVQQLEDDMMYVCVACTVYLKVTDWACRLAVSGAPKDSPADALVPCPAGAASHHRPCWEENRTSAFQNIAYMVLLCSVYC